MLSPQADPEALHKQLVNAKAEVSTAWLSVESTPQHTHTQSPPAKTGRLLNLGI